VLTRESIELGVLPRQSQRLTVVDCIEADTEKAIGEKGRLGMILIRREDRISKRGAPYVRLWFSWAREPIELR
jgi:hypothetical protein